MKMQQRQVIQILATELDANDVVRLEGCLVDPVEDPAERVEIATQSAALLSEINDVAYTIIVSGFALDYLASVILRIRGALSKCTVFDFRSNTMAVSQYKGTGDLAGKYIVIGPQGEVTISSDQHRSELLKALREVTGLTEQ